MMAEPDKLISTDELEAYAAGDFAWAIWRSRGVNYEDVLAGLGELGLRPPIAPMGGPNLEARRRGVKRLRDLLGGPKE